MARQPTSWLVVEVQPERPTLSCVATCLIGTARYDIESDLIIVTTPDHRHVATQGGGANLKALAKLLLSELHRKEQDVAT